MLRHVLVAVLLLVGICQSVTRAAPIKSDEVEYQTGAFKKWFDADILWRLADLPESGQVADYRIPYSGHDYPDKNGGTHIVVSGNMSPLAKYDLAFYRGRSLTVAFEQKDVEESKERTRVGLFGRRRPLLFPRLGGGPDAPGWYGHCNGWTAASIRHAEPQHSVVRNGVTFTPADIKALLAEVYMYADSEFLGGVDHAINPGTLHVVLCNWLGRGDHPVGMESALGEVVFNYPIYAFTTDVKTDSDGRRAEVRMEVTYAYNSNREMQKAPRISKTKEFHYLLELDAEGKVVGGQYYNDSQRIDMLWVPLNPPQGGRTGNERGNPYISVKEVMAIWQASVPQELADKWLNIDPLVPQAENSQESPAGEEVAAARPATEQPAAEVRAEGSESETAQPRRVYTRRLFGRFRN